MSITAPVWSNQVLRLTLDRSNRYIKTAERDERCEEPEVQEYVM